jgi:hypothetical protein
MKSIHSATPREKELAASLRKQCIDKIANSDPGEACAKLGFAPTGLAHFIARATWSLESAFRAADALGLYVADQLCNAARTGPAPGH